MEVSGQFHAPAALPPEKNPGTNLKRGCVGPRIGLEVSREAELLLSIPGFEARIVHPVVQSLYRLF
jgi:hypothetical protein